MSLSMVFTVILVKIGFPGGTRSQVTLNLEQLVIGVIITRLTAFVAQKDVIESRDLDCFHNKRTFVTEMCDQKGCVNHSSRDFW